MNHWSRWCLAIGQIQLEVKGIAGIPSGGPFVVVSNHQGTVDILILAAVLPFPFIFMAKKELFGIPFVGWHLRRSGHVPVDRSRAERAGAALQEAADKVRAGRSIVFFPEGTRSLDGKLQRFKGGAFQLALETGTTIVPIVIRGSSFVLPKGSIRVHPSRVHVEVLEPFVTSTFEAQEKNDIRENVRDQMAKRLEAAFDPGIEARLT